MHEPSRRAGDTTLGQVPTVKTEKKGTHQVDVMPAAFVVIANAVSGDGRQRAPATAEWGATNRRQ